MDSSVRFRVGFGVVLVGYVVCYIVFVTLFPKPALEKDLPNYITVALQAEQRELFERDPVFGDGTVTNTMWSSSYLYLSLLQAVRHLTHSNISAIMAVMQLIPATFSVVTFYGFLRLFRRDRWLTLMLSIGLSIWLLIRFSEGIPTIYYYALIPLYLCLLWQFLLEPGLNNRPVVLWKVIGVGCLIGVSPLLINSVNGLGFSLLVLGFATVQWLAQRMQLSAYVAFCVPVILLLGVLALSGTGGSNVFQNPDISQYMFNRALLYSIVYQISVSFGTKTTWTLFTPETAWAFYVPMTLLIVALSIRLRWFSPTPRSIKIIYLTLCWLFWSWVLGVFSFVIYLFFLYRFIRAEETELDYVLITGLNVGILNAPVLMLIMVNLWHLTHWNALVTILLQMFRFQYLLFFLASGPLLMLFETATRTIQSQSIKSVIWLLLIGMVVIQPFGGIDVTVGFVCFVILVILLLALASSGQTYFTSPIFSNGLLPVVLLASVFLVGIGLNSVWLTFSKDGLFSQKAVDLLSQIVVQSKQYAFQDDYDEMTEWLRLNTPLDSLIHFDEGPVDRLGFFRYSSQRALLFTWLDEYMAQFRPDMSAQNMRLVADVEGTPALLVMDLARRYDVNYIVIPDHALPPLPLWGDGGWYTPHLVYENPSYRVYEVARLTTQAFKAWLSQVLAMPLSPWLPEWTAEDSASAR